MEREDAQLRKMTEEDLRMVLDWRNSSRIRSLMHTNHLISWEEHKGWFAAHVGAGKALPYIFEINGEPAGLLQFTDIDRKSERCHWGFYLSRDDYPKGTGTLMGSLGVNVAFEELGIRKLCAELLHFNIPSLRMHQKLGFRHEGTLEKHYVRDGKCIDVHLYAIFNETKGGTVKYA